MKVNRKEEAFLNKAIDQWQKDDLLNDEKADQLRKSVSSYKYEYDSLSVYAFVAAISCIVLAFGALVLDEKWVERFRKFFELSQFIIGFAFAGLSVFLFWVSKTRIKKFPDSKIANETFNILLALSIGVCIYYFARGFGATFEWYGFAILIIAVLLGICAWYTKSKLLWLCMMLAIVVAWGVQTWAWSDDESHAYFLGMNYPLRMTVLGLLMIIGSWFLRKMKGFEFFKNISWHAGWLFFLLSGLALSVSGNLDFEVWDAVKQGRLFIWALAYSLMLIGLIVFAVRTKDDLLRDMLVIFFLLNLYTRFFEYFWDRTNKGLFFAILALSFWFIGQKAEKLRRKFNQ